MPTREASSTSTIRAPFVATRSSRAMNPGRAFDGIRTAHGRIVELADELKAAPASECFDGVALPLKVLDAGFDLHRSRGRPG